MRKPFRDHSKLPPCKLPFLLSQSKDSLSIIAKTNLHKIMKMKVLYTGSIILHPALSQKRKDRTSCRHVIIA
jgi:hypothetical protein